MAGARFEYDGAVALAFQVNPSYPGRVVFGSGTVRAETEGGGEYAYKKGAGYAQLTLKFDGMPAADFDGGFDYASGTQTPGTQSLANWFFKVAGNGGASFTYRDPFGGAHDVRFMDDRLEFSMTDHGLYSGVINLRERLG